MKYLSVEKVQKSLCCLAEEILDENSVLEFDNSIRLKDIGFDSLTFIRFIVDIEELFDMEFEDEYLSIENLETLEQMVIYIMDNKPKKKEHYNE